ncbi:UNVERIFIED_ORG: NitT/TauT family transport system substrate-binding protein [Martelella mediterranea]
MNGLTNFPLRRRTFLTGMAGMASLPAIGFGAGHAAAAAPLAQISLSGPPAGPSVTLAQAAVTGAFSKIADKAAFNVWRNPDEVRAGITSGQMSLVVMPVQAAANMYNRGFGVRLVNTLTDGLLYIIATDPSLQTIEALRGRKLAVPFRNDTPDLILKRLLKAHDIDPEQDLSLDTTGTPVEAMQLLLSGRIDAALVPEPAASAAIIKGKASGVTVTRVIDVQKAWGETMHVPPVLPQAGLAVTEAFFEDNGSLIPELHMALVEATAAVNSEPAEAANNAASALGMPWPVLKEAIGYSNLTATQATTARPAIESLLSILADSDPGIIGGKLPDDGFYAL